MRLYILDDDEQPIPCDDVQVWAFWMEQAATTDRRVLDQDEILDWDGRTLVSTVFLGLDHNHLGIGLPLLFETMVFGGALNGECVRYSTRDEALSGHDLMAAKVRALPKPKK